MHVLADVGQSRAVSHDLEFHTFVHRLCMCNTAVSDGGWSGMQRTDLFLFSQVRAGFRNHRQEEVGPGASSGKLTARSRERTDANKHDAHGSTSCPQGILGCVIEARDGFALVRARAPV